MTDPTEAEVAAGADAIRWLADEAIDPVEVARDVLTAAAQVRREQEGSLVQATTEPAETSRDHPGMARRRELFRFAMHKVAIERFNAVLDDGFMNALADAAADLSAAQVRPADQNLIAEIDRLRVLLKSIAGHPDTHALVSGVIQNELDRKPALMPIYGATEDQGPDVLGMRKGDE